MSERIIISFRDNETDKKLLEYLKIKGEVIGKSSYVKQLLYEDMLKNKNLIENPTKSIE